MILSAKGVSFGFSQKKILSEIDLELCSEKLTVLIGPNGSGKTTLLRLLSGYYRPLKGEVLWEGEPLLEIKPHRRSTLISVVLQEHPRHLDFSLEEILALESHPQRGSWSRDQMLEALREFGLEDRLQSPYSTLSGGQKQRLWLACSSLGSKSFLLADEPTNHLDHRWCHRYLRALKKRKKALICLHDLTLALVYADQIVLLDQGGIRAQGTPREISELFGEVFSLRCDWIEDERGSFPLVRSQEGLGAN